MILAGDIGGTNVRAFLARIPIKVVVNDACALLGAARLGAESGGAA